MLFCFDIGNRFQTDAGCSGKFLLCDAEICSGFNKMCIRDRDMCMGEQQYSKEQWDEKITDSINYFLILCAIVEEELNEEN